MSKSWIVMSMNMPPETRIYSMGGGAGSRLSEEELDRIADLVARARKDGAR